MSAKAVRAQGVLLTTLVDFLLQIIFVLVLILVPVLASVDMEDLAGIKEMYPQIKRFIPEADNINWQELELALVPKAVSQAYAADPKRLGEDLASLYREAGLDPKTASLKDLKAKIAQFKGFEEKAAKYDKLRGAPMCSLDLAVKDPHSQAPQPLFNLKFVTGGFLLQPAGDIASQFLAARTGLQLPASWQFYAPTQFQQLFAKVNAVTPTCRHVVVITEDNTGAGAKEEFKRLMTLVDQYSYKKDRTAVRR